MFFILHFCSINDAWKDFIFFCFSKKIKNGFQLKYKSFPFLLEISVGSCLSRIFHQLKWIYFELLLSKWGKFTQIFTCSWTCLYKRAFLKMSRKRLNIFSSYDVAILHSLKEKMHLQVPYSERGKQRLWKRHSNVKKILNFLVSWSCWCMKYFITYIWWDFPWILR